MTAAYHDLGTIKVEIAFDLTALDQPTDPDYTDVTAYVRDAISIRRGRSSEFDTFQTGTMSLALDNRTRLFDPDYAAGTYYGKLLPNRHIRASITDGVTTWYLFKGWIEGWPQSWEPSDNDATVNVVAYDWFKFAARALLPESYYAWYIFNTLPTAWYRLGEPTDETVMNDLSFFGTHPGYYNAGMSTAVDGLIELSQDGARSLEIDTEGIGAGKFGTYLSGVEFSLEFWFASPAVLSNGDDYLITQQPIEYTGITLTPRMAVTTNTSAGVTTLFVALQDGTNSYQATVDVTGLMDQSRHHLVFTRNAGTATLYLDGTAQSPTVLGSIGAGQTDYGTHAYLGGYAVTNAGWVIDDVSFYDYEMNSTAVAVRYAAGSTAGASETTTDRLTTARGVTLAPAAVEDYDTSTVTVRGFDCAGGSTSLLAYGQLIAATEGLQARWFVAADGTIVFHNRYHDTLNTTVQAAFTDAAGTTLPYADAEHEFDDARVYNDVTVGRENGTNQRASDLTNAGEYGQISLSRTGLQGQSDDDCRSMSQALLAAYKDPHPRIRALVVKPRRAPTTLLPKVAALEIGDRVTFRRAPMGGTAWTQALTIEGISHQITVGGDWTTTYLTAPTTAADAVAVWDSGVWDTNVWGV